MQKYGIVSGCPFPLPIGLNQRRIGLQKLTAPFDTIDDAAKWGDENMSDPNWLVIEIDTP